MRVSKEEAVVHSLARMYKYVDDLTSFCERNRWDIDNIFADDWNVHAISKCIEQLGEYANNIRKVDKELFNVETLKFHQIIGMRNRLVHEYHEISYSTIKDSLLHDVPKLREFLVDVIPNELLEDPHLIFDDAIDSVKIYQTIIEKVTPSNEQEQDSSPTL